MLIFAFDVFQIIEMPPTGVPLMNAKAKFKCNFFNNGDVAYVHMSGIFDFVENFTKYAPKAFKKVSNYGTRFVQIYKISAL